MNAIEKVENYKLSEDIAKELYQLVLDHPELAESLKYARQLNDELRRNLKNDDEVSRWLSNLR